MSERHVSFDQIVHAVCAVGGISRVEMMAADRSHDRAILRFTAWWLADKLTPLGPVMLGRLSGHRDHSSVMHGQARVEKMRKLDPEFRAQTDALLGTLIALERHGMLRMAAIADPLATARRVLAAPEREAVRVPVIEIVALCRLVVEFADAPHPPSDTEDTDHAA